MIRSPRILMQALVGALVLATLAMPLTVNAQVSGVTLTVNGCDSSNYPDIVCTVTPVNGAGVPLQQLDASAFQVTDGNTVIPGIEAQKIVSPSVKVSTLLLVDFGMIQQGVALQPLKDSAKAILQAAGNNDRLAVLALTGPVQVNTRLDATKEYGFAPASQKRDDMINLINAQSAVGRTPLYDEVCKALLIAAQEHVGTRAVIVLSDGADVQSQVCTASDTISHANKDRTPVFTIGVGPNVKETYLRKLASETGGLYDSAAQLQNVIDVFKRMESALKTEYRVTFHMPAPGNGQLKTVDIKVTQGSDSDVERATFQTPQATRPTFTKVTFTIDGNTVNPKLLPANKTLIVEPTIQSSRPVTSVDYIVGGNTQTENDPPFQLVIPTNDLIGVNKITLRASGEPGNPAALATYDVQVSIDPSTLVTPTPAPAPTLLQRLTTFPGILIVAVFLILLIVLIVLLVLVMRRRSRRNVRYIPETPPTMVGSAIPFQATSVGQSLPDEQAFPTALFNEPAAASPGAAPVEGRAETVMFKPPVAVLEFTNGELSGRHFDIGSTGAELLVVGREPDSGSGAVRVPSQFVSRKHAQIAVEDGKIILTDLNSSSGTKLNGERLPANQPREIHIGDKVDFADVSAVVKPV